MNVKKKYYGNDSLDITGPGLLGNFFTKDEKNAMELYHSFSPEINKKHAKSMVSPLKGSYELNRSSDKKNSME